MVPETKTEKTSTTSATYSRFWDRVPTFLGWIFALSALFSLLGFLFRYTFFSPFFEFSYIFFFLLGVPAASKGGAAALLGLIAVLLFMRKRLAVVIVCLFEVVTIASLKLSINALNHVSFWEDLFVTISWATSVTAIFLLAYSSFVFPGRFAWRKIALAGITFIIGQGIVLSFGFLLVKTFGPSEISDLSRIRLVFNKLWGSSLLLFFHHHQYHTALHLHWLETFLGLGNAIAVIAAILVLFSASSLPGRTKEQDVQLRLLLDRYGEQDSLGYYATRNNRSIIFSDNQQAAVTFGVAFGVAMAGGDPVGNPEYWTNAIRNWKRHCYQNGLIPAVISASDAGARAYRKCSMMVRAMGDEAIIDTSSFQINAPVSKPLAAALRRAQRENMDIAVRRQSQISPAELQELSMAASVFRRGEERGFSMALDRMFAPQDAEQMVVTARDRQGRLQCLLTFVPWGRHGVSLNLMRRDRNALNGIVEAMVVTLIQKGRDQGIDRISLNFAMFREVFVEGESVDASWSDRAKRFLFVQASKFWQLESLYQSNARYGPTWLTRYFCFPSDPLMSLALLASAELEGFLPTSRFLRTKVYTDWEADQEYLAQLAANRDQVTQEQLSYRLNDQQKVRYQKAQALKENGREPFPPGFELGESVRAVKTKLDLALTGQVKVSGRIVARRNHGGVKFWQLRGQGETIQLVLEKRSLSTTDWNELKLLDLGDQVVFKGQLGASRTGTPSVIVESWQLAAKSLRPHPRSGVTLDAKTKTRDRTLALLHDWEAMVQLRARSAIQHEIRQELAEQGFLEVETPVLQTVQGGANARPFVTHLNAYDTNVFLRIAPELYLKRLAVAGMDAVFEMGRSFRNEGADLTHNPEFTSLEVYRAGWDYNLMADLTERLIIRAATAVHGRPVVHRIVEPGHPLPGQDGSSLPRTSEKIKELADGSSVWSVDISQPWPRIPVYQAVSDAVGEEITPQTSVEKLQTLCLKHGIELGPVNDHGVLIGELYDELVEGNTILPTFYYDFPVSTSPLTRQHRSQAELAERWDLVAWGMELGTAYTELTDPREQRKRFTQQSLAAAAGDPEAMSLDDDFLRSLELGMLPTGGLGLGIDRLAMLVTGGNIRQVLAFPFVRPKTL